VTAKVSKTLMDKTIGSGTLSTDAGQGGQTVTLIDDDGKTVGQVPMGSMHFVVMPNVQTQASTSTGLQRHVWLHVGVCFVAMYHVNFRQSGLLERR
jgi:hypothetical protein